MDPAFWASIVVGHQQEYQRGPVLTKYLKCDACASTLLPETLVVIPEGNKVPPFPRSIEEEFVCLFVCWNKTRKTILRLLSWEGSKPPGSDHTWAEAQTTCVPKTAADSEYVTKENL